MSARLRACSLGLVMLLATVAAGWGSDDTIYLEPGVGSLLRLERPFETVLIDNPQVVDVHRESDRAVVLKALSLGSSNVVFIDEHNIAIVNVRVVVSDAKT